jgi:hypothetical protein
MTEFSFLENDAVYEIVAKNRVREVLWCKKKACDLFSG